MNRSAFNVCHSVCRSSTFPVFRKTAGHEREGGWGVLLCSVGLFKFLGVIGTMFLYCLTRFDSGPLGPAAPTDLSLLWDSVARASNKFCCHSTRWKCNCIWFGWSRYSISVQQYSAAKTVPCQTCRSSFSNNPTIHNLLCVHLPSFCSCNGQTSPI